MDAIESGIIEEDRLFNLFESENINKDNYLTKLRTEGEWGNTLEIEAFAIMNSFKVVIFRMNKENFSIDSIATFNDTVKICLFLLLLIDGSVDTEKSNHYNALIPLDENLKIPKNSFTRNLMINRLGLIRGKIEYMKAKNIQYSESSSNWGISEITTLFKKMDTPMRRSFISKLNKDYQSYSYNNLSIASKNEQSNNAEKPEIIREKRNQLDDSFRKKAVLEALKSNNNTKAAKLFGVHESTIRSWIPIFASKEEIKNAKQIKQKRDRNPQIVELESKIIEWFNIKRAKKLAIHERDIKQKALEISKELKIPSERFKASNGWLWGFKSRRKITLRICTHVASKISEYASVAVENFLKEMRDIKIRQSIEQLNNPQKNQIKK
jgi:hypothetical protein